MTQPGGPIPNTLATYRDVRVSMVVIMIMLFVGVIIEKLTASCWQLAISAYYYTTAHSIVIAASLALGTLFIVHRGSSDTEDVLLTPGRRLRVDRRDGAAGPTRVAVRAS